MRRTLVPPADGAVLAGPPPAPDGAAPAMTEAVRAALPAVGATLRHLAAAAGAAPPQARAGLRAIREAYPEVRFELLWQREAYDGSLHYDALLHLPGQATISLSVCPEPSLPWPLRGMHRADDRALLRVNQTVMEVDQAVACLDVVWDETRLMDHLVRACLVQEALDAQPLELSDAELQAALDA
ncbi:MAG TPA: hypothetical protein VNK05_11710, partial [Chloroflexota bacterium]|nr:hypothetical protein [Chloroflexota bacterium]